MSAAASWCVAGRMLHPRHGDGKLTQSAPPFGGSLFDLTGRSAVVTGSSRGIGRAIAHRLAQHGANVVISGRNPEPCEAVAAEINGAAWPGAGRAIVAAASLTQPESLEALATRAEQAFGAIDILVANAAIHIQLGPSADITDAALTKTMDANFMALHRLSQRLLPAMISRQFGRIVNIGSIAALFGSGRYHSYTISKIAAMQYVRNIAVEHGAHNIRANTVAPGLTRTEMASGLINDPELLARELSRSTVGRYGEPDEIAGAVVFLVAPAGSYVNGQTLAVDGGMTIRYD